MSLKYSSIGGGTSGFAVDTGDGTKTDVSLLKEYPAGGYQISSANGNQELFVFLGANDGSPAGGTASKSIVATKAFNKITIIGATPNDLITFTYKETATLSGVGTSSSYSGAVVTSFTPNEVSQANDTIILNGAALGENVTVKFVGANNTPLDAKSITRVSDTQLIVTRPDIMPGDQDPYRIVVQNPGIEPPVSTSVVSKPLYAGLAPTWSTPSTLPAFTKNSTYTQQLIASDPDATAITYSFVSGSLPPGLTYATNSSVISGTPTGATSATFTIRATEASGRYTDRTFTLPNAYPVFTTLPTLPTYTKNVSYSATIVAIDDSGVSPALSVVGSMPAGLSFNALTGAISGTPTTSTNQTFTIRATDANGSTVDQVFTIPNSGPTWVSPSTVTLGLSGSQQLSATDDGTLTYSVISSGSPDISVSSSGLMSASASATPGSYSVVVRVTDDAGNYQDKTFTVKIFLYSFSSHTFTNAGASGPYGPNLATVRNAYSATSWAPTYLNMSTDGYQKWTVPATGNYRITAVGAKGANGNGTSGGAGARVVSEFTLNAGDILTILVGQMGTTGNGTGNWYAGGGGGGTFVALGANQSSATPLVVAGGGGGAAGYGSNGNNAPTTLATSYSSQGSGGSGGGNGGSAGSGYNSVGANNVASSNFTANGYGDHTTYSSYNYGGFGGGGEGGGNPGGGGGGFTGGNYGTGVNSSNYDVGAHGGTNFASGSNTSVTAGIGTSHGYVTVEVI